HDKKEWFKDIPRLAVVGVSDWITEESKKSFLASANSITRIYNWVDLKKFKPIDSKDIREKLDLSNKFVIIGVASHWKNEKGLDRFLKLAARLNEGFVMLLIGDIDGEIELPRNIIHIKETHNIQELVHYYSLADVLLNLS